jgi:phosphodiesterase/alkaline phosphatase D-like protein
MPYLKSASGAVVLLLALLGLAAAHTASADPDSEVLPPVAITHGPIVENVTAETAIIAWSTNVNSGTTLRYGTDPDHLDQTASMPWGGFTHRVYLKGLQPATKYFFQAESSKAQGTGTTATAQVMSFETKATADAGKPSDPDRP